MSVFYIWKASKANTSNKYITTYSGADWSLEETEYKSNSYILTDQLSISDSVIALSVNKKSTDWVGTELLDKSKVPYQILKDNDYGTYEHIGEWYRFIVKSPIKFEKSNLDKEFKIIKAIVSQNNYLTPVKNIVESYNKNHSHKNRTQDECLIRFI